MLKTKQDVVLDFMGENVEAKPLVSEHTQKNIRNIYTFEQELMDELENQLADFTELSKDVIEFESYKTEGAQELIIAHGIVGAAAKDAIDELQNQGKKVGLFRPITLSPFPTEELNRLAKQIKKVMIVESSLGQLRDLVKQNLDSHIDVDIDGLYKPAVGIEVDEIVDLLNK